MVRSASVHNLQQISSTKLTRSKSTLDLTKIRSILKTPADKPSKIFGRRKSVTFSTSGPVQTYSGKKQNENLIDFSDQPLTSDKSQNPARLVMGSMLKPTIVHANVGVSVMLSNEPSTSTCAKTTSNNKMTITEMVSKLNNWIARNSRKWIILNNEIIWIILIIQTFWFLSDFEAGQSTSSAEFDANKSQPIWQQFW